MKNGILGTTLGVVALSFAGYALAAGPQSGKLATSSGSDQMAQTSPSSPGGAGSGASPGGSMERSPGAGGTSSPGASSGSGATSPGSSAAKPANPPQSIVGKDVVNNEGKKIGEIEKIAGDQVIVSVGGFLGLGAHDVALSWKDLNMTGSGDKAKIMTSMTEKELKALPEYQDPSKSRSTSRPSGRTSPGGGGLGTGGAR